MYIIRWAPLQKYTLTPSSLKKWITAVSAVIARWHKVVASEVVYPAFKTIIVECCRVRIWSTKIILIISWSRIAVVVVVIIVVVVTRSICIIISVGACNICYAKSRSNLIFIGGWSIITLNNLLSFIVDMCDNGIPKFRLSKFHLSTPTNKPHSRWVGYKAVILYWENFDE